MALSVKQLDAVQGAAAGERDPWAKFYDVEAEGSPVKTQETLLPLEGFASDTPRTITTLASPRTLLRSPGAQSESPSSVCEEELVPVVDLAESDEQALAQHAEVNQWYDDEGEGVLAEAIEETPYDVSGLAEKDVYEKIFASMELVRLAADALADIPDTDAHDMADYAEGEVEGVAQNLCALAEALRPHFIPESMYEEGLDCFDKALESLRVISAAVAQEPSEDLVQYCEAVMEEALELLSGLAAMLLPKIEAMQQGAGHDDQEFFDESDDSGQEEQM